jgi:hypothetical protein
VILSLIDAFDDVLVYPFVRDGAVVAFDMGVLLGLAWLDGLSVQRDGRPVAKTCYRSQTPDNAAFESFPTEL